MCRHCNRNQRVKGGDWCYACTSLGRSLAAARENEKKAPTKVLRLMAGQTARAVLGELLARKG